MCRRGSIIEVNTHRLMSPTCNHENQKASFMETISRGHCETCMTRQCLNQSLLYIISITNSFSYSRSNITLEQKSKILLTVLFIDYDLTWGSTFLFQCSPFCPFQFCTQIQSYPSKHVTDGWTQIIFCLFSKKPTHHVYTYFMIYY